MNRLPSSYALGADLGALAAELGALAAEPGAVSPEAGDSASGAGIGSATLGETGLEAAHAVFTPLHYEPNYAYPLVVWLHGPDESEASLRRVMTAVSIRNYVAVAPRGTTCAGEAEGDGSYGWSQSHDHIYLARQRILHAIDLVRERLNIHPQRIVIAGADCGGTMAFRVAMNDPQQFAGVVSLGGAFPSGEAPLARLLEARRLPLFVAAARQSRVYPAQRVCDDLRLFYTAGMSVTLKEYPGTEHVTSGILADVDRWIMESILEAS